MVINEGPNGFARRDQEVLKTSKKRAHKTTVPRPTKRSQSLFLRKTDSTIPIFAKIPNQAPTLLYGMSFAPYDAHNPVQQD